MAQPQQTVIVKSLHNGELKRFRLDAAQLSAERLASDISQQHGLQRGKFSTKLEVKGRDSLSRLGTNELRAALAAETGSSVVLRLYSFSVSAAAARDGAACCAPLPFVPDRRRWRRTDRTMRRPLPPRTGTSRCGAAGAREDPALAREQGARAERRRLGRR